jgi:uncharacterized protein (TIGR03437 family)
MRMLVSGGVFLALASVLPAQTATIRNAAYQSPTVFYPNFLVLNPYLIVPVPTPSWLLFDAAAPQNIIAPGMLAVLTYSNAGPGFIPTITTKTGSILPELPVTLSIRPSGSNIPFKADVVTSAAGSVTFIVPPGLPAGGAEVEYKVGSQPTAWTNVNVVPASFEFFRIGPSGPVVAQSVASDGSLKPVGLATPAQPGQTVLLTGSGLGNATPFQISVGGLAATIVHPLTQRADPGYDRIFVQIPAGAPDGCYVPLTLTYNQTTVTTSISKTSNGAPCVHPFQLSTADLQTLDSAGSLSAAQTSINTSLQVATSDAAYRSESVSIQMSQLNAAEIAAYFQPAPSSSCSLVQPSYPVAAYVNGNFGLSPVPDLGSSVTLQNGSTTLSLTGLVYYSPAGFPAATEGPLSNLPAPVISAGKWTWTSSGGPDLPASSFGFSLPAPFQLNSGAPVSLNRGQDQTLTWNGANFPAGAVFTASLSGNVNVSCSAPASAGTLTIPASLLARFSSSFLGTLSIGVSQMGSSIPHALFKLKNGNTLLVFVSYSTGDTRAVDFQ